MHPSTADHHDHPAGTMNWDLWERIGFGVLAVILAALSIFGFLRGLGWL